MGWLGRRKVREYEREERYRRYRAVQQRIWENDIREIVLQVPDEKLKDAVLEMVIDRSEKPREVER